MMKALWDKETKKVFDQPIEQTLEEIRIFAAGQARRSKEVLQKYSIPSDRQEEIFKLLGAGFLLSRHERRNIQAKDSLRQGEKLDLERIIREIPTLSKILSLRYTRKELELFESMMNKAILIERFHRKRLKPIVKLTKKRTIIKLQYNSRSLKIYTPLIKNLARIINPVFRDKIKDKWLSRTRKEEATFQVVAEVLNSVFKQANFTPKQVKARFHKAV